MKTAGCILMWIIESSMVNVQSSKLAGAIFKTDLDFENIALKIFQFQAKENIVYKNYIQQLKINPEKINKQSFLKCFKIFYGSIEQYCLLALLPSYLERKDSSLIYMTDELISRTKNPVSGFYLDGFEKLFETIQKLISEKQKFILLGV